MTPRAVEIRTAEPNKFNNAECDHWIFPKIKTNDNRVVIGINLYTVEKNAHPRLPVYSGWGILYEASKLFEKKGRVRSADCWLIVSWTHMLIATRKWQHVTIWLPSRFSFSSPWPSSENVVHPITIQWRNPHWKTVEERSFFLWRPTLLFRYSKDGRNCRTSGRSS